MNEIAEDKADSTSEAHRAVTKAALACAERAEAIFNNGTGDYHGAVGMMVGAATALATIAPHTKG